MLVYYFNDENHPITVKWRKPGKESWEWEYHTLEPQTGGRFQVLPPSETQILWVKKWQKVVMFSLADIDSFGADEPVL